MRSIKKRTITLVVGIIVALSAVAIGASFAQSHKVAELQVKENMPSVDLIDFNKVFYILFHK